MNNNVSSQAQFNEVNEQQLVKHINGEPIRMYPFKIVQGLDYMSNRGAKPLGTNFGNININADRTGATINTGAYSGATQIDSGNKPIMCYWFGVTNSVMYNSTSQVGVQTTINAQMIEINKQTYGTPLQFKNPFNAQTLEYPGKEVGVENLDISHTKSLKTQLDNVECATYETVYNYQVFSNNGVPSMQEINEFFFAIIDFRYMCPILLRIINVSPHFSSNGQLQYCDISLQSINQYFNNTGRSILTFVKFGAIGDGYAFPQEVISNGIRYTTINEQLLNPQTGGVKNICVKNNSLVAQFGAIIYGHPYVPYLPVTTKDGIRLQKLQELDRYLLPATFTAPTPDNFVSKDFYINSSYDVAGNMIVINEQMGSSGKQVMQFYNPISPRTFQGGLAFNFPNNIYTDTISKILPTEQNAEQSNQNFLNAVQSNLGSFGSENLANILQSNQYGLPLDRIASLSTYWFSQLTKSNINGFATPPTACSFDVRGIGLGSGFAGSGYQNFVNNIGPSTSTGLNSSYYDLNGSLNLTGATSISPTRFFVLNSMSMINTKTLEINYRDGILYTNTNQGHGGFGNTLKNWFSGIADKFLGYTPGDCEFFLSTIAKSYNMLIPSSLAPLFNQYLNPGGDNYNAIPLDIFDNHFESNTSVGQMRYMSGYEMELTGSYSAKINGQSYTLPTTYGNCNYQNTSTLPVGINQLTPIFNDAGSVNNFFVNVSYNNNNLQVPVTSIALFEDVVPDNTQYVIDEINIMQLGQSNIHLSYYQQELVQEYNPAYVDGGNTTQQYTPSKPKQVLYAEDGIVNTAKLTNNNAYIQNDFDYYVYDEYNTKPSDNASVFVTMTQPASYSGVIGSNPEASGTPIPNPTYNQNALFPLTSQSVAKKVTFTAPSNVTWEYQSGDYANVIFPGAMGWGSVGYNDIPYEGGGPVGLQFTNSTIALNRNISELSILFTNIPSTRYYQPGFNYKLNAESQVTNWMIALALKNQIFPKISSNNYLTQCSSSNLNITPETIYAPINFDYVIGAFGTDSIVNEKGNFWLYPLSIQYLDVGYPVLNVGAFNSYVQTQVMEYATSKNMITAIFLIPDSISKDDVVTNFLPYGKPNASYNLQTNKGVYMVTNLPTNEIPNFNNCDVGIIGDSMGIVDNNIHSSFDLTMSFYNGEYGFNTDLYFNMEKQFPNPSDGLLQGYLSSTPLEISIDETISAHSFKSLLPNLPIFASQYIPNLDINIGPTDIPMDYINNLPTHGFNIPTPPYTMQSPQIPSVVKNNITYNIYVFYYLPKN